MNLRNNLFWSPITTLIVLATIVFCLVKIGRLEATNIVSGSWSLIQGWGQFDNYTICSYNYNFTLLYIGLVNYSILGSITTRQSVAVQRDGASQLAKKYPLQHSRNAFLSYFTQPPPPPLAISQRNITTSETIYTCAEDYPEEAFSKIPVQKMVAS